MEYPGGVKETCFKERKENWLRTLVGNKRVVSVEMDDREG
jgi:hypothetical protein